MLELTWTCHVCGQERPDRFISVYKSFVSKHRIQIQQNVRYCNDNPDCIAKAPNVKFIKESESEVK